MRSSVGHYIRTMACVGRYVKEQKKGSGITSEVFEGIDTSSGRVVVLKYVPSTNIKNISFEKEIFALQTCAHPHIIQMYNYFNIGTTGVIVQERMDNDLLDIILEDKVTKTQQKKIFHQICLAVSYLHAKRIAHLDIKPENIFINNTDHVKLGDFGSSVNMAKESFFTGNGSVGTEAYCAPEVHHTEPYSPFCADIWSLGILLHVLLTKNWPYRRLGEQMRDGDIFLDSSLEPCELELLRNMLIHDPFKRYTISEVQQSPWLNEFAMQRERTSHRLSRKHSILPQHLRNLLSSSSDPMVPLEVRQVREQRKKQRRKKSFDNFFSDFIRK